MGGGKKLKGKFNDFKIFIKGKRVAVVGIGVSNTPLIRMLINLGAGLLLVIKVVILVTCQ